MAEPMETDGVGADGASAEGKIRAAAAAAEVVEFGDFTQPRGRGGDDVIGRCAVQTQNDIGNAARLLLHYGQRLMYVQGRGWYAWMGTHWSLEDGQRYATLWAQRVAGFIRKEVAFLAEQGPDDGEGIEDFQKRLDARRKWSVQTGMDPRIRAMLAQAEPRRAVHVDDLDAQNSLFVCENGTLELIRGEDEAGDRWADVKLRPHDPADLMTRRTRVAYDADAACPRWERFLQEVQPDYEKRMYLQRVAGYCLTGWTSEEKVFLSYGLGSNGKSLFWEIMGRVLGDYSITLPVDTFLDQQNRTGSAPTPDLARLPGVRMVRAGEPRQGARLGEDMIKRVTGTDRLTARQLNQPQFEFQPRFKLTIQTNHKPKVGGQDNGIWRRLELLGWDVIFVEPWEAEANPGRPLKDPGLMEALLEELPGILAWAVRGFRDWATMGVATPESVRQATADYRSDSNPLGQFIADCTAPTGRTQAATLYRAYAAWCRREAVDPLTQTAFGKLLGGSGIKKEKAGAIFWAVELTDTGLLAPAAAVDDRD